MKARIKFQKYGYMKFIGHLDVLRYFQKAFRRAGYDSEYTQGFNPHQIMSFAAPLGVGLTSDAEYVDIGLRTCDTPETMVKKINEVLSEGFYVTGFHLLTEDSGNGKMASAMSLVASADYLVSLKDGCSLGNGILSCEEFRELFEKFYSKQDIIINKKTKKSEKMVNIKPMISFVAFDEKEYDAYLGCHLADLPKPVNNEKSYYLNAASKADAYENNIKVYMQLDTGSASNLKPELVMEAFCSDSDLEYNPYAWQVHRLEIYTRDDETKRLIPLDSVW